MTRAKFICNGENKTFYGIEYSFSPVTDGNVENEAFFNTTPGGKITLQINPLKTSVRFELGAEYYVDFNGCDGKALSN